MKLKDALYIAIIAFLAIKLLFVSPSSTKYVPASRDSLESYKSQVAALEVLLAINNNERDSISKLKNKIKIKYEKEYRYYLIKDSVVNSLSVDSIQRYWTKRYFSSAQ
jgi:hypothetical protein